MVQQLEYADFRSNHQTNPFTVNTISCKQLEFERCDVEKKLKLKTETLDRKSFETN